MTRWFEDGMTRDLRRWLDKEGELVLREIGVKKDQTIMDFGCGSGNYAIPAAKIVGMKGKVYALDRELSGSWTSEGLEKLIRRVKSLELENIVIMKTSGELKIKLDNNFLDAILVYDVLHHWYFPRFEDRRIVLGEFYRILKPDGFISFYPGDPEIHDEHSEINIVINDIKNSNFQLKNRYSVKVIHEDIIQKGHIMNFTKI